MVWNTSQRPEIIGRDTIKTKYLGGNSNILAGSFTLVSEPFLHGVSKVQKLIAAPLNPMDSLLLARGLCTLDVRMQRHGENAMAVARMLEDHPVVVGVYYPGLDSHLEHPASMTHSMIPREQRMKGDLKDGLIRISVGLERARNLVDDLRKSLDLCDDKGCDVLEDL